MKRLQSGYKQQLFLTFILHILHIAVMNIAYQTNYLLTIYARSVSQSVSRSVSQSVSQSVSRSVSPSVSCKCFLVVIPLIELFRESGPTNVNKMAA